MTLLKLMSREWPRKELTHRLPGTGLTGRGGGRRKDKGESKVRLEKKLMEDKNQEENDVMKRGKEGRKRTGKIEKDEGMRRESERQKRTIINEKPREE